MKEATGLVLASAVLLLAVATIPMMAGLLFDVVGNERERRARMKVERERLEAAREKERAEKVRSMCVTKAGADRIVMEVLVREGLIPTAGLGGAQSSRQSRRSCGGES